MRTPSTSSRIPIRKQTLSLPNKHSHCPLPGNGASLFSFSAFGSNTLRSSLRATQIARTNQQRLWNHFPVRSTRAPKSKGSQTQRVIPVRHRSRCKIENIGALRTFCSFTITSSASSLLLTRLRLLVLALQRTLSSFQHCLHYARLPRPLPCFLYPDAAMTRSARKLCFRKLHDSRQ